MNWKRNIPPDRETNILASSKGYHWGYEQREMQTDAKEVPTDHPKRGKFKGRPYMSYEKRLQ